MVIETAELDKLKGQLIEKLRPSGWVSKLKTFIFSDDFDQLMLELMRMKQAGTRFTPPAKQIFSAFERCPYDQLKVIILSDSPYPDLHNGKPVADGMAFSCSNTDKVQNTLQYVLEAVARTVYPGEPYEYNPDLSRWAAQGVLMLNLALTTEVGKTGAHYKMWKNFLGFVLDILDRQNSGLHFIFCGKATQQYGCLVDEKRHYKYPLEHPNASYYRSNKEWDCQDVFNEVNQKLMESNNVKIIW